MNTAYSRLKQIYLGIIPIYPLGYVLVHGFRGDQIWTRPYVNRSSLEPSEHLKELVEQEIEKIDGLKKAKFSVALTDEMEAKVYGGLFLSCGAELQFPLRMSLDDVETARRLGANLELDLGLSKHRRKVEVTSETGDELIARLMLSEAAKRFLVQKQLQIANSGEIFCAPIFGWLGISTIGYGVFTASAVIVGPYLATGAALAFTITAFSQFVKFYNVYQTGKTDALTASRGEEYAAGAIDYFESTMKLNRLFRQILGEEGVRRIAKNGDLNDEKVPFSTRIREIRKIQTNLRRQKMEKEKTKTD